MTDLLDEARFAIECLGESIHRLKDEPAYKKGSLADIAHRLVKEVERLEKHAAFGKRMLTIIESMTAPEVREGDPVDGYIRMYEKQKADIERMVKEVERLRKRLIRCEDAMNTHYCDSSDWSKVDTYLCDYPIYADPALAAEEAKDNAFSKAVNEAEDRRKAAAEARGE